MNITRFITKKKGRGGKLENDPAKRQKQLKWLTSCVHTWIERDFLNPDEQALHTKTI